MNTIQSVPRIRIASGQSRKGYMLLEVLVSILLFAFAFVAIAGLQARSITTSSDIQYRAEAVGLANAYVAKMWAYQDSGAELSNHFATGSGAEFQEFKTAVQSTIPLAQEPVVTISNKDWTATTRNGKNFSMQEADVEITISWVDKATATDAAPIVHHYNHVTTVGFQPNSKP